MRNNCVKLSKEYKFSVGDILEIAKNGDVYMPKGQKVRVVKQKRAIYDNMALLQRLPEKSNEIHKWFFEEDLKPSESS